MRKEIYRMPPAEAVTLFARAPLAHVASTTPDGAPVLRAVHPVVVDDWVAFHGAPAGEKMDTMGRAAVIAVSEVIAEIPSWFLDEERACPATTYYLSAQAHGTLEEVDDADWKARALQTLMSKYQPEGRHVPLTAASPLYAKAIEGLLIARLRLDRVDGKSKLGQNRALADRRRVVAHLRARARPEDLRAATFLESRFPELARPAPGTDEPPPHPERW